MLLGEMFDFLPKSKRSASYGRPSGKYPFFTSSNSIGAFVDFPDYDGECLIIGDGGTANCKYYKGKFSVSDHNYVLEPHPGVNARLVNYFLMKDNYRTLQAGFKGVGIKNVSKKYIASINFNSPSVPAEEILACLDGINQLIEVKQQTTNQLDSLVKSRFIEMFGNPGVNEFSYPEYTIGELAKDYSYGTSSKANDKGLTPYLRMGNMTDDGKIDLSDLKYITLDHKEYEKSVVRDGDLLFNRTNSADHVGRTCAFHSRQDMVIAGYIVRVRLKQELSLADYVAGYMNSTYMKGYLKSIAKRAVNQANISASAMAKIKIFVPPIEKQKEYLGFLKLVDKSEFVVRKQIKDLQELLDSKMDEYFGGEEE